eukprot:Gb_09145 [translate_table: standard]
MSGVIEKPRGGGMRVQPLSSYIASQGHRTKNLLWFGGLPKERKNVEGVEKIPTKNKPMGDELPRAITKTPMNHIARGDQVPVVLVVDTKDLDNILLKFLTSSEVVGGRVQCSRRARHSPKAKSHLSNGGAFGMLATRITCPMDMVVRSAKGKGKLVETEDEDIVMLKMSLGFAEEWIYVIKQECKMEQPTSIAVEELATMEKRRRIGLLLPPFHYLFEVTTSVVAMITTTSLPKLRSN